ncbi:DUF7352 domain-containing protein [Zobellia nedashkovskayae]
MKVIYKYPIETKDKQLLELPIGFEVLRVANQRNQIVIWALIDEYAKTDEYEIEVHGTGNPIYDSEKTKRKYLGTALCDPFVWHVFHRIS